VRAGNGARSVMDRAGEHCGCALRWLSCEMEHPKGVSDKGESAVSGDGTTVTASEPAGALEAADTHLRVLVAEDDPVMRSAISELIQFTPGLELVGVAPDADVAVSMATSLRPHVALLDVRMPNGGGLKAARAIADRAPEVRMVAFSAYATRSAVLEMLRAGVHEYVVKGANSDVLIEAIKHTGRGYVSLPPGEIAELIGELLDVVRRWENNALAKADLLADAAQSADAALTDLRRRVIRDRNADIASLQAAIQVNKVTAADLRDMAVAPMLDE
jgi:DNA-binding NarL/FixJ family response regulator